MSYALSDLGLALQRRGQRDEAIATWTRSLAIRRTAVAADPKNVRAIHALATILNRLGREHRDTKRAAEALAAMRDELHWRDTLLTIQGPSPGRLIDQGFARLNLIGVLLDLPADMKPSSSPENDAAYRQWYDTQAARIARSEPPAQLATDDGRGMA